MVIGQSEERIHLDGHIDITIVVVFFEEKKNIQFETIQMTWNALAVLFIIHV